MNFKPRNILPAFDKDVRPHRWFEVKDGAKVVEISIMDEIGGWGISARHLVDRIKAVPEKSMIKLHIFSPGGDVMDGNEIYNALKDHKGGVEVTIGALCASIATVIAMAGSKITIAKNGLFMIHNPWVFAIGESDDLRRMADVMDKMKKNIVDTYHDRTKLPADDIVKLMDEESWFTADEAKAKGFVDAVDTKDDEPSDVKDRFDLTRFKNSASALSRIRQKTPAPAGSEDNGHVAQTHSGETKPKKATAKQTPTLIHMYQSGKIRVFNSILMGSIAGMLFLEGDKGGGSGGGTAVEDPPDENKVKELAKTLYQAKLKRDTEIDEIVLAVRKRDKKDFSDLATKFKREDKTPDEFARALTTSDEFKPHDVIGSGIEVGEVRGLPRGTPGELFVASEEYKAIRDLIKRGNHKHASALVEMKDVSVSALDQAIRMAATTSGGLTSIEKLPGIVTLGARPLMVKDLIAPGATNNTSIRYIQETTLPGGAGPDMVAEGAAKPEVTFALNEITADVKKIAAYTKVTDELFADFLAVASYINMRLPYLVERKEEDQLLNGDGTGNNLLGILNFSGVQTQARGGDTSADAIYKAFTKIRWGGLANSNVGGFEPDGIVIHPTNWESIRLAKDGNNQYFGGGPFTGAYGNGPLVQFDSLWGKPVVITPAIALNTALVGAFRLASQYFQRQGLTLESTNTDQDDFIKNLTTIRAEERLALAVYRPPAFCQVTGLN